MATLKDSLKAVTAALLLVSGCGDGAEEVSTQDVSFAFAALVNQEPFSCDGTYTMGTMSTSTTITELKFYVSDFAMLDSHGNEVPVTLKDDGKWQNSDVALLDFEDGTGGCSNGTPDLNDTVVGTIPEGEYQGVVFTLGIPFENNHQDAAVAEAPLNLTQMFWSWQGGYKFMRIDGKADATSGFRVHLGSTGCMIEDGQTDVSACASPNRPRYTLASYNAEKTINLNVERLFEDEDMTPDADGNSSICMSSKDHIACETVFEKMNLSFFGENDPQKQVIFSTE